MGSTQCSCRCSEDLTTPGMLRPRIVELPVGQLCSGEKEDEDEEFVKSDVQPSWSSFSTVASTAEEEGVGGAWGQRGGRCLGAGGVGSHLPVAARRPPPAKGLRPPGSTSSRPLDARGNVARGALSTVLPQQQAQHQFHLERQQQRDRQHADLESSHMHQIHQRKKAAAALKAAAAVQAVALAVRAAEAAIDEAAAEEAAAVAVAESRFVPSARVHKHVETAEKRGPPLPASGVVSLDRRANSRRGGGG